MGKNLTIDTINERVKVAKYAVRGELVLRAQHYELALREREREHHTSGGRDLPFDKVVYCNIGNPQQLTQPPLTYFRQILALCDYPQLLESEEVQKLFPADVIARARCIIDELPGKTTGAYTESKGLRCMREEVAHYIHARDGHPANIDHIYLTNGASAGVKMALNIMIRDEKDAVMVPIPQYPLYTATLAMLGGTFIPYYLNEEQGWSLSVEELQRAVDEAKAKGYNVRAMAVINPGNPTGQVLSEDNVKDVVRFCVKEGIALLADEVYQENVYAEGKKFVSFKKARMDIGEEANDLELFSFHSVSKGFLGECGRRGGYLEVVGLEEEVEAELYKMASVELCSNVPGQITTGLMVSPPREGEPSFELYNNEKNTILSSLKKRAHLLAGAFNRMEGVTCNDAEGAMYLFPRIHLPTRAVEAAKAVGKAPDAFYCFELLDNTGICVVPGSGFGQVDGTFHFRTTFLPPEKDIEGVIDRMEKFHDTFMKKYA
eukprot:CAMPEP_0113889748 /NCGR_PEP_ID=MMETSP0780_2-20120614/13705_1 /TAXON_ID=652834 /ORGANISM="Palpitomonas bilix" /LENGTH=489 /DNA_ID=CAMNT_0000878953 /DNA_START=184 /DNA_END=1653 /DNA_ORIENTATION=- /assembly_acc=CAM_ASM_000599